MELARNVSVKFNEKQKQGGGLKMIVNNRHTKWKYWDEPRDLLKRLELLYGSKQAGHDGHDAEIKSILSEMLQKKLIKPLPKSRKR